MHDIKSIKNNPSSFDNSLKKRNLKPLSKNIIKIHEEYLNFLNEKQDCQEKKNTLSKLFSKPKSNLEEIKKQVQDLKKKIDSLNKLSEEKLEELNEILLNLPNTVSDETPDGKSEDDNTILKVEGKKKSYSFKPKDHLELAESLDLLDYEKAIKISGSRFSILKNNLALLHRALVNLMLDNNTIEFKFNEIVVPELVKMSALIGTGQLPKFEEDLFKTNFNDLYLIPTAEVPLVNINRDSIIDKKTLPLRYTSYTNCFRSEAGASGKDTKGLIREHQFGKVELVTISDPANSKDEFQKMISCVENILNKLELPYRIIELCSADLGFSASYTQDFEIWMPGQKKYREVSSCSNCKDFQSRRMKMRIKDKETDDIYYPHTLNCSSLAVGRVLVAILENFQNSDGSIEIPSALNKYTNGLKKICYNDQKV